MQKDEEPLNEISGRWNKQQMSLRQQMKLDPFETISYKPDLNFFFFKKKKKISLFIQLFAKQHSADISKHST